MADVSKIKLPDNTVRNIKDAVLTERVNSLSGTIPFAQVDSTSTATVFTATVPEITELKDGTCVMLKNGVITSASGFTLNINGLGAHHAFNNLTAATADTTIFNVNYTMLFVYDSTRVVGGITGAWCCYRGYDSNTNTIGYQIRINSGTMKASDTSRYYKIFFTSANGKMWVPASVNSTNNATTAKPVNQRPIDPFGAIVYTSANTNFPANSSVSATALWQQYNLTLGYSFNRTGEALTLTDDCPVYVKCAPQKDGSAIMDADEPIVQTLPSAEDGKIYIYLGQASSATAMELNINHPVYYYKDGAIRLWTGSQSQIDYISKILFPTYDAVDIGLSVFWSSKNVGAENNSDKGNYYSYGEIETKDSFSSATYTYTGTDPVLTAANDAATQNVNNYWRMPTKEELEELLATKDNDNYEWNKGRLVNGEFGVLIKYLINGNSIFLPSCGYYNGTREYGSAVELWSSTSGSNKYAYRIELASDTSSTTNAVTKMYGQYGMCVRPVCDRIIDNPFDEYYTKDEVDEFVPYAISCEEIDTLWSSLEINFSIENEPYKAKDWMTWADWVTSSYNTLGLVVTEERVMSGEYYLGRNINDYVSPSQKVTEGNYILHS